MGGRGEEDFSIGVQEIDTRKSEGFASQTLKVAHFRHSQLRVGCATFRVLERRSLT